MFQGLKSRQFESEGDFPLEILTISGSYVFQLSFFGMHMISFLQGVTDHNSQTINRKTKLNF